MSQALQAKLDALEPTLYALKLNFYAVESTLKSGQGGECPNRAGCSGGV